MIGASSTWARVRALALVVASAAALALALAFTRYLLPTDAPPPGRRPEGVLRVATANVAYDNPRVEELSATMAKLDADVLVVLEWTGENPRLNRIVRPELRVVLEAPSPSPHGVLVLARRTLPAATELVPAPVPGPCPLPIATLRLRARGEWISVLGVHAPPPIEECEETNLPTLRFFSDLVQEGRLAADLGAGRRGDRVVLAGDLNASPASPGLGWLRAAGLVDTHARHRWVPRGTWASERGPHLVRLDYVLGSSDIEVLGSWTIDLPGSDHRAVIADLRFSR